MLLGTQAGLGLVSAALGAAVLAGDIRLWQVVVLAVLFGIFSAVDNPARQAFTQEVVVPAWASLPDTELAIVISRPSRIQAAPSPSTSRVWNGDHLSRSSRAGMVLRTGCCPLTSQSARLSAALVRAAVQAMNHAIATYWQVAAAQT